MRKFTLLTSCLFCAALTASAQTSPTFGSLTEKSAVTCSEISNTEINSLWNTVTATSDNNVVLTGSYNIIPASGAYNTQYPSQFILKKQGTDLAADYIWGAHIDGSAYIKYAISDGEGGVYLAGNFADEISVYGSDKAKTTLAGLKKGDSYVTDLYSVFIAHYDKDGKVTATTAIVPQKNTALDEKAPGMADYNDCYCTISDLALYNGKLYAALNFAAIIANTAGDVTLTSGSFLNTDYGFDYPGNDPGSAVAEIETSNLNVTSFPIYMKGYDFTDGTTNQTSLTNGKLLVDGDKMYYAALESGPLAKFQIKAFDEAAKEMSLTAETGGNQLFGYVVAAVDMNTKTIGDNYKFYSAEFTYAKVLQLNDLFADDNSLYLTGTCNDAFPFDSSVTPAARDDIFAASLSKSSLAKNWAVTTQLTETPADGSMNSYKEALDKSALVNGNILLSGHVEYTGYGSGIETYSSPLLYVVNATNGNIVKQEASQYVTAIEPTTDGKQVYVASQPQDLHSVTYGLYDFDATTGITAAKVATKAAAGIYSLSGVKLSAPAKGVNIQGGKKFVVK